MKVQSGVYANTGSHQSAGFSFVVFRGLICCVAGISLLSCRDEKPVQAKAMEVNVVKVISRDVLLESVYTGETFGEADIEIAPRVTGLVESINFREGSIVKEGQLLYTIDHLPYLNRVDQAKGALSEAQTYLARTKADLDMIEPLAKINAVSQRELVFARAQYEAAKGRLQSSEAALRNAEIELGYCNVTAPIGGLIGISKVRVGDYVTPGPRAALNTISKLSDIRVRFTVSEQEFMRISREARQDSAQVLRKEASHIQLILSNGETYPLAGKLNFADRQVDPSTGAITVEALFGNSEGVLRPGQYVKVVLVTEFRKNALLIPQRTVNEMQGVLQVFTVNDSNKVAVQIIKPGPLYRSAYLVEDGLKAGERVIYGGTRMLKPGLGVIPKETKWDPAQDLTGSN
ncbi:MAG TPA: efflux RND transporter periplasmic adaptor subunit [Bacteroidia bacterium]|nr:efflux RND transporter periplasmic adaptor subunit [Bacteroidia bacterium]